MGWSIGYDSTWGRDIGYGVPAWCDHPECSAKIDRGLAYVCGSEPYGGDAGCGLYFCERHRGPWFECGAFSVCVRCAHHHDPFKAKPDHPEWLHHKATDPSWAEWRAEYSEFTGSPGERA